MAFNLCAAFLQMLSVCDWKVNLLSKNTPNNISQVLFMYFSIFYHYACF